MVELLIKGGPVMILLLLCSVVGVYIIVQKILYLRANRSDPAILDTIEHYLTSKGKEASAMELSFRPDFASRVLAAAIRMSGDSRDEIREGISELTSRELPQLEKNLGLLASIVSVAPILGLLGTVLGLMDIFNVISGGGIGDASLLSSGIAQALISTVTGLSIAIPFIIAYQYLSTEVDNRLHALESNVHHVIKFCKHEGGIKP